MYTIKWQIWLSFRNCFEWEKFSMHAYICVCTRTVMNECDFLTFKHSLIFNFECLNVYNAQTIRVSPFTINYGHYGD